MGSGCAVGYPKEEGEPALQIDAVYDSASDEEIGQLTDEDRGDVSSKRKINKVRGMLAEEGGGGRLGDDDVERMLRSASKMSLEYGYRRHVDECMARLESVCAPFPIMS